MASHTMTFSLNDVMYEKLAYIQSMSGRDQISMDLFAKELLVEKLNEIKPNEVNSNEINGE
jgi:hypothetical protein